MYIVYVCKLNCLAFKKGKQNMVLLYLKLLVLVRNKHLLKITKFKLNIKSLFFLSNMYVFN